MASVENSYYSWKQGACSLHYGFIKKTSTIPENRMHVPYSLYVKLLLFLKKGTCSLQSVCMKKTVTIPEKGHCLHAFCTYKENYYYSWKQCACFQQSVFIKKTASVRHTWYYSQTRDTENVQLALKEAVSPLQLLYGCSILWYRISNLAVKKSKGSRNLWGSTQ